MRYLDEVKEAVRNRYAIYSRPRNGMRNVLIDSFMPKLFLNYLTRPKSSLYYTRGDMFPASFKAISEFTAELAGVPVVPREELVKMLGYNMKDIKKLLTSVKRKQLKPLFLGYGGTNVNTLYWLKELCRITNIQGIFKNITVMEPDVIEPHNVLRFPMNLNKYPLTSTAYNLQTEPTITNLAANMLQNMHSNTDLPERDRSAYFNMLYTKTFRNVPINSTVLNIAMEHSHGKPYSTTNTRKILMLTNDASYKQLVSGKVYTSHTYLSEDFLPSETSHYVRIIYVYEAYTPISARNTNDFISLNNTNKVDFIYGAPDIATRQLLAHTPIPLITATHGNDDASLHMNPSQDSSLQVESYGMIKLGIFFMNQLRLAIGLLEALDKDEHLDMSSRSLLEYSFPQHVNESKSSYNIQIAHSGTIGE